MASPLVVDSIKEVRESESLFRSLRSPALLANGIAEDNNRLIEGVREVEPTSDSPTS